MSIKNLDYLDNIVKSQRNSLVQYTYTYIGVFGIECDKENIVKIRFRLL